MKMGNHAERVAHFTGLFKTNKRTQIPSFSGVQAVGQRKLLGEGRLANVLKKSS